MGTEAQQALQKRTRAISPGGGARNVEGTRHAQQQALRKSARPGHVAKRKRQREEPRGDQYGREIGDGQVGAGYGGMGYGPLEKDSAMKRAQTRADPRDMARQVLSKVAENPINYRPEGSIFDDPKYSQMANERGANFAMKARNFDRKLNMARQGAQIRHEAQQSQLAMDEGKLRDQQLQHAMRQYAPQNIQGTGVDPATGLATSGTVETEHGRQPVFTGDIKQVEEVGPGPASEAQVQQQQAQAEQQNQLRQKGVEVLADRIAAEYDKPSLDRNDQKIQRLEQRLDKLLGLDEGEPTAQPKPYSGDAPPESHPDAKRGNDGVWYVKTEEGYRPVLNQ